MLFAEAKIDAAKVDLNLVLDKDNSCLPFGSEVKYNAYLHWLIFKK